MPTQPCELVRDHTFDNGIVVPAGTAVRASLGFPLGGSRDGAALVSCEWGKGRCGAMPLASLRPVAATQPGP